MLFTCAFAALVAAAAAPPLLMLMFADIIYASAIDMNIAGAAAYFSPALSLPLRHTFMLLRRHAAMPATPLIAVDAATLHMPPSESA